MKFSFSRSVTALVNQGIFIMLPPGKVKQIERLLIEGLSQRKVAVRVGVSRNTVQVIFQGKRKFKQEDDRIIYFNYFTQITKRCPICGVKVKLPCLKCQLAEI